ncbi:acyl-CoA dehydrogenase [Nonomuraea sp. WAC 01424]|uniref:acyl-CoA dehydrogenase family protein n=1 Tax=Nonomuraea sp. WAC 01424 TaxID=2203200 RepID=UPI000F78383C|nr:acyl-CoA dehydrogenase family protein [Nonomuraea sp. WAC 01424]RSM96534.1 acyl-CoA dehydrogenase [Nonomuraea sp. WAC 01424]
MTLSEELGAVVRAYLADRPEATWQAFARDVGVAGLLVPERYGGAGCGPAETAAVAEELGRALSPHPFLQSAVMAVAALMADGDDEARARLLPELASGATTATVVLPGDGDLRLEGDRLSGVVPYGLAGEVVLAYAGAELVEAVPARRTAYPTVDETRPLVSLAFDRAPVRRLGPGASWTRVRDLAIAALAAEQAGGAARCLEMAVGHARSRRQFGRPIGSFQAIKHKLADVLLLVESAPPAARAADGSEVFAAVAGSYCTEAYLTAAGENIQVHGGIGVTWEHPAHRYLKRAASDAQLFGPPQAHRARLAPHVLGEV